MNKKLEQWKDRIIKEEQAKIRTDAVLGPIKVIVREKQVMDWAFDNDNEYEVCYAFSQQQKTVLNHRENWIKFGVVKEVIGPEEGVTVEDREVEFVIGATEKRKKREDEYEEKELERIYKEILGTGKYDPTRVRKAVNKYKQDGRNDGDDKEGNSNKGLYRPPGHSDRDDGELKLSLRIINFDEDTKREELYLIFSKYGAVRSVHIGTDRDTGDFLDYAYVNFYNQEDCIAAHDNMQGHQLGNYILGIEYAKSRE